MACKGLRFQPRLCEGMGNTIQQMLDAMGSGMGNGMMGGYGMVGLYGGLPEMFGDGAKFGERGEGRNGQGNGRGGQPHGENPGRREARRTVLAWRRLRRRRWLRANALSAAGRAVFRADIRGNGG